MKKVIIIGASGFVGSAILNEVLNRGNYEVTAVVRNPDKITIKNPNLTVIAADVSEEKTVVDICKGFDVVISAYNAGWTNPNIYDETLKTYPIILDGVKKAGVKRFLIVGGAGTLLVAPRIYLVDSGRIPTGSMPGVRSLGEFYQNTLIPEKEIDWVFFSPAANLVHGKRTGNFRLGKDDLIVDKKRNSTISVEDYALAMVDELEIPEHHQERFTIGY